MIASRPSRLVMTLVAGGALVGFAGCSSEGNSSAPSGSVSADPAAFCQSVVDIQSAVVKQPRDMEAVKSNVEKMKANAPADLATQVPIVSSAVLSSEAQPAEGFIQSFADVVNWIGTNCNAKTLNVAVNAKGKLSGVPATERAGITVLKVTSTDGKAYVGILRKADGVTETGAELLIPPNKKGQGKVSVVVAGNSIGVGELTPGNYVVAVAGQDSKPTDAVDMTVK